MISATCLVSCDHIPSEYFSFCTDFSKNGAKSLHKPKQARMNAGLWGRGKVAFVEQEQRAKPHVCWVFCGASQAYDEGSIPFTRSSRHRNFPAPPYHCAAPSSDGNRHRVRAPDGGRYLESCSATFPRILNFLIGLVLAQRVHGPDRRGYPA